MSLPLAIRVNPKQRDISIDTDRGPLWWKVRLNWKNFNVASTTANVDFTFPGGIRLGRALISLITPFSGGSVSAATLSLGTTGSPATYLAATNVFTGASSSGAVTFGAGAGIGNFLSGNSTPVAVGTVRAQLLTTTDNASSLTAGVVDVFLELSALSIRAT